MNLTIDGISHSAPAGEMLLATLRRAGIELPALCADPRLRPAADCRLCSVDIEGGAHPVTSCNTPVVDGMRVITHSESLERFRRQLLEWMASRASAADMEAFPDKPLHRALSAYGVTPAFDGSCDIPIDDSHPTIRVDMSRCITCYRCVRICDEVQGQSVWHAIGRADSIHMVPDSGTTLAASSCVSCGACVDTCPTTALLDKNILDRPQVEQWTRTVCSYCGVGCEMNVGTIGNRIASIRPTLDAPVNKGHLCVKGRYAHEFVHSPERILSPMLRRNDAWQNTSWDEALGYTAREMQRLIAQYGPDAVGVLGSARATNEENYLAQKFARIVVGTHNVDCCARVCHTPSAAALKKMLGTGAGTNSFDDIEIARCFLIAGANPSENHPIVGARIKQRLLRGEAQAIVIDPRRTELARHAHIHLALRPGTNVPLFNAMAQAIIEECLYDADFVANRVENLDAFRQFIKSWTPERAGEICGVDPQAIRAAARLYANCKPAMSFHGLGLTEHIQGTEGVMCLVNLALLTGNLGVRGAGINPLRGQNNVQGAAHMGCDPGILTGSVALEAGRAHFEHVWNAAIPTRRGLNLLEMIDAAAAGRLKALYVIGYDIFLTLANATATRQALEKLELVIVQDLFLNETAAQFGTVFLPAAASFEKDGTFMNAERRIQRIRQALPPPGDTKTDWQILCELALRMGKGAHFDFVSAESIWNEVRAVWADGAGISYARLDRGSLQWPCRSEQEPDTEVLHRQSFVGRKTAALQTVDYIPTAEVPGAELPFLLTTGRTLYQFNAGTMTQRSATQCMRPTDTLDLCESDARLLGIHDGDAVRVSSRYGEAVLPARIEPGIQSGQLFATFHDARNFLNRVTGSTRDRLVQAPEYKVTAVRIERA